MASKKSKKDSTNKAAAKAEKPARKAVELAKEEAKKARKKAKKAAKLAKEEAAKLARKAKERAKKDAKKAAKNAAKPAKPAKPEATEVTPAPAKAADPAPITTLGTPTDDWSVVALRARAREIGLTGYSKMTKAELLAALRR